MPAVDPENFAFLGEEIVPVMGFSLDVVNYSEKTLDERQGVQARLPVVTRKTLADVGFEFERLPSVMAGDGLSVFLPVGASPIRVLPGLLSAAAARLAEDNEIYRQRIRARMSVGFGLAGRGASGLSGDLVIDLRRFLDCETIRRAALDHPESDLVALVAHGLYELADRTGRLLAAFQLRRVDVEIKEKDFSASAWLFVGPAGREHAA